MLPVLQCDDRGYPICKVWRPLPSIFPGHGDTAGDSHHGLPSVPHSVERLERVEFPPFRAAIDADVKLMMTAHLALPALDGPDAPPATLSRRILHGLLREELDFKGVIVTDAMDMGAIRQGKALGRRCPARGRCRRGFVVVNFQLG